MESVIDISMSDVIATIAVLVAILSALYARWSVAEAKKANDNGSLNSLFSFKKHYHERLDLLVKKADLLKGMEAMSKVHEEHAEIDTKLRHVNSEIEKYHKKI